MVMDQTCSLLIVDKQIGLGKTEKLTLISSSKLVVSYFLMVINTQRILLTRQDHWMIT